MNTVKYIWISLLFPAFFVQGQTLENGDVFDKVSTIISNLPLENGDDYTEPTNGEVTDWIDLLDDLFAGDYGDADTKADALGYDLVEYSDNTTNETYYILEKLGNGANYWGTYILNPNAQKEEVILMAPHPRFDFNTGKQGIYCFQEIDAGFFMMAGTHRCNHTDTTTCSGTTEVCGNSSPYQISDLAHSVNSIWQTTTEYLFNLTPDSYFIQLHGFTKTGTDPYVIMSNGTRETPGPDPITAIRDELLIVDPMLTFKIGHIDLAWDRLLGFTNTNGRLINSSNNFCSSNATATSGRFVHIEQEKTRLRSNSTGWQKMATALNESFPLPALPVDLVSFDVKLSEKKVLLSWLVESETNNDFFEVEKSDDGKSFHRIGKITGRGHAHTPKKYQFLDTPNIGDNYYRLRQVDYDGNMEFSPIKMIKYKSNKRAGLNIFSFDNQIIIHLNNEKFESPKIQLFDPMGRMIASVQLNTGENKIPLGDTISGFCLYRIIENENQLDTGILLVN